MELVESSRDDRFIELLFCVAVAGVQVGVVVVDVLEDRFLLLVLDAGFNKMADTGSDRSCSTSAMIWSSEAPFWTNLAYF